jgi:nicotinate-nucleotide adenylyltransferase
MLELALAGHEQIKASRVEIDRGGVSYTLDTLAAVRELHPAATLFFLMGADSLRDLPTWREPRQICELAIPAVVRRGGAAEPDFGVLAPLVSPERLAEIRAAQVEMPLVELSSTDLRERAASGRSLRFRTPRAVEKYIESQGLYRIHAPLPRFCAKDDQGGRVFLAGRVRIVRGRADSSQSLDRGQGNPRQTYRDGRVAEHLEPLRRGLA